MPPRRSPRSRWSPPPRRRVLDLPGAAARLPRAHGPGGRGPRDNQASAKPKATASRRVGRADADLQHAHLSHTGQERGVILDRFLTAAALWADRIVIADQGSTDGRCGHRRGATQGGPRRELPCTSYDEASRQRLLLETPRGPYRATTCSSRWTLMRFSPRPTPPAAAGRLRSGHRRGRSCGFRGSTSYRAVSPRGCRPSPWARVVCVKFSKRRSGKSWEKG